MILIFYAESVWQDELFNVFQRIAAKGRFPKIRIQIETDNSKNYKVVAYDFLEESILINKEIISDIYFS